jgi:vitellogenic carboxypeptidase-like protein
MKALLLFGVLLVAASCVYTSSYFRKRGRLIDGLLHTNFQNVSDVTTQCNVVNLNITPYNYDGVVRSGYLNIHNKGSSALAFIFYGKEKANISEVAKTPTIIWLNGGPGSSSQLGNLMELGPYWLVPDSSQPYVVVRNNNSWVKDYNVLFVDQPVGTGLSYADPRVINSYVKSMDDVAEDFYNALYTLYTDGKGCFNGLGIRPDAPLFIFGESYAGKYVPAIGAKIVREKLNGGFLKGLKGVAIGDGFTDPFHILAEVGGFAFNFGLIDYQERAKVEQIIINATFQEREQNWAELHDSFDRALDLIVEMAGGINVYDLTKYRDYPGISQLIQTRLLASISAIPK